MLKTQEGWLAEYAKRNAGWIHDGNPRRPHAILTSGRHSGGYFHSKLVFEGNKELLREASENLVELLLRDGQNPMLIDCVVGPSGAAGLAENIASLISDVRGIPCGFAVSNKGHENGNPILIFGEKTIEKGDRALVCDDVLFSGGTLDRAVRAIVCKGGSVQFRALCIVNRTGVMHVGGRRIISLINRLLPGYDPAAEVCPFCSIGSQALLPKNPPENWQILTKEYPLSSREDD